MNLDKKAEEYYKSLVQPLADAEGLVVTSFVAGALAMMDYKDKTDFEKFINDNHPDPDSLIHIVESEDRTTAKVFYEEKQIFKLAELYAKFKYNDN